MKKIFLCAVLLLCTVIGNATAIWNGNGQGTASSPYEIWNLDRLNEVRNFVGDEGAGKYFRLEKDLDLAEYLEGLSWEPIGSSTEPFKGVFLGNGKKITGMTINGSSNYQGFFGYISGATIQDLTIEGSVKGAGYAGGIVGCSTGTNTIKNCSFNGNVTGSGSYVGGIAGSFGGTLSNVTHTGTTKGVGYVGGIVGQHTSGSMTTAMNTGNVTATSSSYAGGIVGYSSVAISSANSVGTVTGKQYTGGLAGISNTVNNSSADGPVTGTNYTGGLVGQSNGTISGCSAKGKVTGQQYTGGLIGYCTLGVSNSRHSNGAVNGTNYVGGLVGNLASGSVTSCYVYAPITGTNNVGGIVGCYTLSDGNSPQIVSSGYFGNISASQYVGGVLGSIDYTGNLQSGNVTKPTLHTYQTYGSSSVVNTYQETLTETENIVSIKNCAVVGDVIGTGNYVGGILGKDAAGEYLSSTSHTAKYTRYDSNHILKGSDTIGGATYYYCCYYKDGSSISGIYKVGESVPTFTYYTYTYSSTETSLTDNYFSGNLKGADFVGGVVGHMQGGTISRNYSYAAIEGSNKVGGIVGYMQADAQNIANVLSSNVALNSTVTASSEAGKVYGNTTGSYLTIATTGNSINKTLNTTRLVIGGVTQETTNDAQNGTLQTQRMLLQSTAYSGLGWNFNSGTEWTSEESVSYPYKQWQTAPPTIKTGAVKGSTSLSGTCTDNGTVYVTIEGNSTVYEATCSGGNWSLTVPTLKSGTLIRAWSKSASKEQSYQTSTNVSSVGSGTEDDPWLIYDAYDMAGVAKAGYYKMMNDVSLTSWISENSSSTGWTGVGSNGTGAIYFDGNNKKVTGIWCNTTAAQNGLFSYLENATIKDLTVEVASGKQMKSSRHIAILAGQLKNSTVTNVTVKGNVCETDYYPAAALIAQSVGNTISECKVVDFNVNSTIGGAWVAGLVAKSENDNISSCSVNATINTAATEPHTISCRGGVVAELNGGDITDCSFNGSITTSDTGTSVGGIVGDAYRGSISKCQANATITATGKDSYNGGLAGYVDDSTPVSLCFTEGTIVASGENSHSAGLVAYTLGNIENCMSTANVTGTGYVGGIVGETQSSVKNCIATGSLLNTSNDGRAGGIAGYIEGRNAIIKGNVGLNTRIETGSNQWGFRIIGGTGSDITRPEITDNYGWDQMPILRNNATKTVYDDPYEGTAKTTAQLQQQSTYEALGWDFTDVWTMTADGFPELQWLASSSVMKGDLNGDGEVSITDVVLIIDVIAEVITDANQVAAADVNNDGEVTITDCVAAIDLIAEQQSSAARRATDNGQRSMSNAQWSTTDFISASMQDKMLNVCLDNERSYTAFQMVVTMPEGMSLVKATMDSERGEDHQVTLRDLGNGQYLVVGFSMDNDKLAGNSGRLLTIVTDGQATGSIVISNVEFATVDAEGYRLKDAVASSMTTGVSEMVNSDSSNSKYYDLQGRRVAAPAKGLYIVNGKKINLK